MREDRARLTITDIVLIMVAFAGLAALYPVFYKFLNENASYLTTGQELLFLSLLPFGLVVLIALIFQTALIGDTR